MRRSRYTIYFIALAFVGGLLLFSLVLTERTNLKLAKDNALAVGTMSASRAVEKVNGFVSSSLNLLTPLAVSLDRMLALNAPRENVRSFLADQTRRYAQEISPMYVTIDGCLDGQYVGGADGTAAPDSGEDPPAWFTEGLLGGGQPVIVSPFKDRRTGKTIFAVAKALSDGKSVISIGIDLQAISGIVDNYNQGLLKTAYILDRHGIVISHPNHKEIGRDYFSEAALRERPELLRLSGGARSSMTGGFVSTAVDGNGHTCLVFVQKVIGDWLVFVSIDLDRLNNQVGALASPHLYISIALAVIVGVIIVSLLRSEHGHLTEARRERNRAIAANRAKSFFFATVSHDIRTPLNSILGLVELLQGNVTDPETRRQYLETIAFSGHTLMQLINNILDLSRLEAGKFSIVPGPCDFAKLAENIVNAFRFGLRNPDVRLFCDVDPEMPVLNVDGNRLRQLIFNLLGNAMKFTEQGEIHLKAGFTPNVNGILGALTVSVSDTGVGISKEDIAKIEHPFVQVNNSSQTGGTGLGLAICSQLIRRMGGKLDIESAPGHGSVFSFTIPNIKMLGVSAAPAEPSAAIRTTDRRSLAVLLVDDVPTNLMVLKAMCAKLGVGKVLTANSGAEALETLRSEAVDVVLTDLWMPEMDGAELLARIRRLRNAERIRVYAVTADAEILRRPECSDFTGTILKPITLKSLSEVI